MLYRWHPAIDDSFSGYRRRGIRLSTTRHPAIDDAKIRLSTTFCPRQPAASAASSPSYYARELLNYVLNTSLRYRLWITGVWGSMEQKAQVDLSMAF
jgi:hypothetical protein